MCARLIVDIHISLCPQLEHKTFAELREVQTLKSFAETLGRRLFQWIWLPRKWLEADRRCVLVLSFRLSHVR
jgi:hypothetical protein